MNHSRLGTEVEGGSETNLVDNKKKGEKLCLRSKLGYSKKGTKRL